MNKNIIIVIGIVVIILIVGGIYWFNQSQSGTNNTPSYQTTNSPSSAPTQTQNPTPTPTSTQTSVPVTHNVMIKNFSFSPKSITVKSGDTVVWTNKDSTGHTVTGDSGGPSSSTMGTNETYSYTFNNPGTFSYHCAIHPSMVGTVVVTQ